ncbi:helix-turn-helix transcriptional regulator [Acidithiobacillus sp. MC6.1]|nr:helix-turn-helix transcriptional regulator [Acidithiobacillus sp. MC6.1]
MLETSRDTYGMLMRRIAQVTQASVAKELNISTSQMSRVVAGETGITLEKLPEFLAALGIEIHEISAHDRQVVTIPEKEYEALITMADIGITALKARQKES